MLGWLSRAIRWLLSWFRPTPPPPDVAPLRALVPEFWTAIVPYERDADEWDRRFEELPDWDPRKTRVAWEASIRRWLVDVLTFHVASLEAHIANFEDRLRRGPSDPLPDWWVELHPFHPDLGGRGTDP